jgi:hypothetical protein
LLYMQKKEFWILENSLHKRKQVKPPRMVPLYSKQFIQVALQLHFTSCNKCKQKEKKILDCLPVNGIFKRVSPCFNTTYSFLAIFLVSKGFFFFQNW